MNDMRFIRQVTAASLAAALLVGCGGPSKKQEKIAQIDDSEQNQRIIQSSFAHQVTAGTRMDRTIYSYHFLVGEAELNRLGEDQIDQLTEGGALRAFTVNIPQGGVADELHKARVEAVRARLIANGIAEDKIAIVDQRPGGQGVATSVLMSLMGEKGDDVMWGYEPRGSSAGSKSETSGAGRSSPNGASNGNSGQGGGGSGGGASGGGGSYGGGGGSGGGDSGGR